MASSDISLRGVRRDTKRFTREARKLVLEAHEKLLKENSTYNNGCQNPVDFTQDKLIETATTIIVSLAFLLNTSPRELTERPPSIDNQTIKILWSLLNKYSRIKYGTASEKNSYTILLLPF